MRGFTAIEIVTLLVMMAVLVALVLVLAPAPPAPQVHVKPELTIDAKKFARELIQAGREEVERQLGGVGGIGSFEATKTECMNNVRNIVALLTIARSYPKYPGPNLILALVKRGEIEGEDNLRLLFCPGDENESFEDTGGKEAYFNIDLDKRGEYGHLTSYAGRDQLDPACTARMGSAKQVVLVCDDSEDHHGRKGFVVGFTGGSVKFRHKFEDYEMDVKAPLSLGKDSVVPELRCMRAD